MESALVQDAVGCGMYLFVTVLQILLAVNGTSYAKNVKIAVVHQVSFDLIFCLFFKQQKLFLVL